MFNLKHCKYFLIDKILGLFERFILEIQSVSGFLYVFRGIYGEFKTVMKLKLNSSLVLYYDG